MQVTPILSSVLSGQIPQICNAHPMLKDPIIRHFCRPSTCQMPPMPVANSFVENKHSSTMLLSRSWKTLFLQRLSAVERNQQPQREEILGSNDSQCLLWTPR
jgi:hypothetical protein